VKSRSFVGGAGVVPRKSPSFVGGAGVVPRKSPSFVGGAGVVPRKWQGAAAGAFGVAAAGAARVAYAALKRNPPGGEKTWQRTNHRGEPVTLLEGPAVALGAIAIQFFYSERTAATHPGQARTLALGDLGAGPPAGRPTAGLRTPQALALAGLGGLGFGVVDDLAGSGKRRGLRGHLAALAHGEMTTGSVKLAGIGATGVASGVLLGGDPADVVINAGLIAGGANLLNLFDLRPGRAIKVATASGALIAAGGGAAGVTAVAAPVGAALALLPDDLGERAMLGDAGANAIGAMLGAAAAASLPRPARLALLAGIVGLTAASEKVSFTKVIERTRPLRWLDMLGRRPAPAPPRQEP
jgi:UDP-GlcNAc:undecaprenyl-phosphate GlcNAc-1-phosphate transferase